MHTFIDCRYRWTTHFKRASKGEYSSPSQLLMYDLCGPRRIVTNVHDDCKAYDMRRTPSPAANEDAPIVVRRQQANRYPKVSRLLIGRSASRAESRLVIRPQIRSFPVVLESIASTPRVGCHRPILIEDTYIYNILLAPAAAKPLSSKGIHSCFDSP